MHGQFLREMAEIVDKVTNWESRTRKGDLKAEIEALIFAAQEQALRANHVKFDISKSVESPLCTWGEKINHFVKFVNNS